MNQKNKPSELEAQLSANAIDAVAKAFNLGMSPQELEEFKQQTLADAQAIANEWELDRFQSNKDNRPQFTDDWRKCQLKDTEES